MNESVMSNVSGLQKEFVFLLLAAPFCNCSFFICETWFSPFSSQCLLSCTDFCVHPTHEFWAVTKIAWELSSIKWILIQSRPLLISFGKVWLPLSLTNPCKHLLTAINLLWLRNAHIGIFLIEIRTTSLHQRSWTVKATNKNVGKRAWLSSGRCHQTFYQ